MRTTVCGGWLIAWGVAILVAGKVWAAQPYVLQTADTLREPAQWQRLPQFDGKEPRCMLEAADGAMWFGQADGIVRYDGTRWTHFDADEGLEPGRVNVLVRAKGDIVHAATDAGVFRFDGRRWRRIFPAEGAPKVAILALAAAADGGVWASFANGLVKLEEARGRVLAVPAQAAAQRAAFPGFEVIVAPAGMPVGSVYSIFEDKAGAIWLGAYSGDLMRLDPRRGDPAQPGAWRMFTAQDGFRKGRFSYTVCQASDGTIWFGSDQHDIGLNRYDPAADRWTYIDVPELFSTDGLAHSIIETSDGAIWVGGFGKVLRFHEGQWQLYRSPDAPVSSSRIALLESRSGDLWLLGVGDDVQRVPFLGRRWLKHEGLNFQCETPDGRQWFVSVDDGVVCFDGKNWWRHGVADGLMEAPAGLFVTRKGELWAAGMHEGRAVPARLEGTRWHIVRLSRRDLAFSSVVDGRAVIEGADGSLWFGAYVNGQGTGLLHYDPAKGPVENEAAWRVHNGPSWDCSFGFAVGGDGMFYSASYRGLVRYDGREWVRLDARQIDALCHTRNGEIWVGTRGAGVYRLSGDKPAETYTIADGLLANGITALFSDRDRNLWVGTSKGISQFDGKEWITDVFPGGRVAISREGGGFRQSADGAIWINQSSREWMRRTLPGGKLQDATRRNFWTVRFRRETLPPKTEIATAVTEVSQPGNTAISWRGSDAWWQTPVGELQFSHRLDGGAWSRFAPETSHVLLQLPPGRHVFEVRARDRDLNVEPEPARVAFVVLPPVWRQPWFVGLMTALGVAIALQSYRLIRRGQTLRAANVDLSAQVEERKKAEGALRDQTRLLEDKTGELERQKISLEKEIEERTRMEREVERVHKELMAASHQAGMAEVATNVLHNIGNVLNSINVSATVAVQNLRDLKTESLVKTADLLQANASAPDFLTKDPRGTRVPEYLRGLAETWGALKASGAKELEWLRQNIDHVKEIVATQQEYASYGGLVERVKVTELVEDAIRMNVDGLARHRVELERDFRSDAEVEVEKNKVVQILVNLLQNAKNACVESEREPKRIVVRVQPGAPQRIEVHVVDTGVGITAENMERIFNHGFTTRKQGHGFGLHASANAAKSIGGELRAHSEGLGQGATFVLELNVGPDAGGGEAGRRVV